MLHIMTTHGGIDVRHAAQSPIAPRGRVRRGGERASERAASAPRASEIIGDALEARPEKITPHPYPLLPSASAAAKVVMTSDLRSRHRGDGSRSSSADHKATRKWKHPTDAAPRTTLPYDGSYVSFPPFRMVPIFTCPRSGNSLLYTMVFRLLAEEKWGKYFGRVGMWLCGE